MKRLVLAVLLLASPTFGAQRGMQYADLAETTRLVLDAANGFRHAERVATLRSSTVLAATAREFASYLARSDELSHTADGHEPSERARRHGYEYCVISENIAYEYSSRGFGTEELARRFIEGWKRSPSHRANLLDREVVETGVAVARSERTGRYYAVQMFGRPGCARGRPKVY